MLTIIQIIGSLDRSIATLSSCRNSTSSSSVMPVRAPEATRPLCFAVHATDGALPHSSGVPQERWVARSNATPTPIPSRRAPLHSGLRHEPSTALIHGQFDAFPRAEVRRRGAPSPRPSPCSAPTRGPASRFLHFLCCGG